MIKEVQSYSVNQQCWPGGNFPETLRGGFSGGLRIFWLNHWQIQTKFSIFFFIFEGLKLCIQGRKIFAEIRYLKNLYLQMHNDFDAGHVQDDKEKSPLI